MEYRQKKKSLERETQCKKGDNDDPPALQHWPNLQGTWTYSFEQSVGFIQQVAQLHALQCCGTPAHAHSKLWLCSSTSVGMRSICGSTACKKRGQKQL